LCVDRHAAGKVRGERPGNDFGNTPLSRIQIDFEALANLPGGGDATKATSISCVDTTNTSVGSVTNSNTFQTDLVKTNQVLADLHDHLYRSVGARAGFGRAL
jgi:hypothetical protein